MGPPRAPEAKKTRFFHMGGSRNFLATDDTSRVCPETKRYAWKGHDIQGFVPWGCSGTLLGGHLAMSDLRLSHLNQMCLVRMLPTPVADIL